MAWAGNVTEVAGLSTRYRVPKLRAPHVSHHNLGAVQWYSPQTGTLDTLRLLGSGADGAIPSSNATVAPSGVATGRPTLSAAPGSAQNVAAHWQVCVPLTI